MAAGHFARHAAPITRSLALVAASMILTACGNSGSLFPPSLGGTSRPPSTSTGNGAPSISGKPQGTATVNKPYSFKPDAYDPNGDVLIFAVSKLPPWATFNAATGEISGVPPAGSTGTFGDIQISVTDGEMKTALPAFSITVTDSAATAPGTASGKATLTWTVPTQNDDGSPLNDLTGYRIYYGLASSDLNQRLEVGLPTTTNVEVPGLTAGTWYFAMTSVNGAGVESARTGVVSMVL